MRRWWKSGLIVSCLASVLLAGRSSAQHHSACVPLGTTTEADHTMQRAGHPDTVACYARAPDDATFIGYPVGGGAPCKRGDYPCPTDGTWGWDYQGCWLKRHVFLYFWHGQRYQGGTGAYKVDGPRLECE